MRPWSHQLPDLQKCQSTSSPSNAPTTPSNAGGPHVWVSISTHIHTKICILPGQIGTCQVCVHTQRYTSTQQFIPSAEVHPLRPVTTLLLVYSQSYGSSSPGITLLSAVLSVCMAGASKRALAPQQSSTYPRCSSLPAAECGCLQRRARAGQ